MPKFSNRLLVDPSENKVEFNIPRDANQGYVNNQRENYNFRFNGVIGPEAKQDEVGGMQCARVGQKRQIARSCACV